MAKENASTGDRDDLLVRELALGLDAFVVAMHGDDRCDDAQLVQHPQRADVARVQDSVHVTECVEDRRRKGSASRRQMGVRDQANTRHDAVGRDVRREKRAMDGHGAHSGFRRLKRTERLLAPDHSNR
jgi:hypothetical protein